MKSTMPLRMAKLAWRPRASRASATLPPPRLAGIALVSWLADLDWNTARLLVQVNGWGPKQMPFGNCQSEVGSWQLKCSWWLLPQNPIRRSTGAVVCAPMGTDPLDRTIMGDTTLIVSLMHPSSSITGSVEGMVSNWADKPPEIVKVKREPTV